MNSSSLISNKKVRLWVSNSCLCSVVIWKQFAPGEVKLLQGAPGPPFLPASSHPHHVFPINLSPAFPFRPMFLALIVHRSQKAVSTESPNVRAGWSLRVEQTSYLIHESMEVQIGHAAIWLQSQNQNLGPSPVFFLLYVTSGLLNTILLPKTILL